MLAYGGNSSDLFQGAFMQSGAPIPVGNITGGQVSNPWPPHLLGDQIQRRGLTNCILNLKIYYDSLVNQTNCASSNDTLSCLRSVPSDTFQAAVNNTPNYFSYQVNLSYILRNPSFTSFAGFIVGMVSPCGWCILAR